MPRLWKAYVRAMESLCLGYGKSVPRLWKAYVRAIESLCLGHEKPSFFTNYFYSLAKKTNNLRF